jgi:hypothetical protein
VTHSSSLVKEMLPKHFSEDRREEVQDYQDYDESEDIRKPTDIDQARFMELLNVPRDRLPSKPPNKSNSLTYKKIDVAVNHMAKSIQEQCECLLPPYSLCLQNFRRICRLS